MSSNKESDGEILTRSKYITDGFKQLNEKLQFKEMKLINSLDKMLHYVDDTGKELRFSTMELKSMLQNFLQISEHKRIQFKC